VAIGELKTGLIGAKSGEVSKIVVPNKPVAIASSWLELPLPYLTLYSSARFSSFKNASAASPRAVRMHVWQKNQKAAPSPTSKSRASSMTGFPLDMPRRSFGAPQKSIGDKIIKVQQVRIAAVRASLRINPASISFGRIALEIGVTYLYISRTFDIE
jgi:hypothetical protein